MIVGALFWWTRAALRRRRRDRSGFRAEVFGDEIAVLTKPIARAFDLDDYGMVEKPVQECGGDDGIAEDFKQAIEAGGNVRKGEHGTKVVFVKQLKVTEGGGEDVDNSLSLTDVPQSQAGGHRIQVLRARPFRARIGRS